MARRRRPLADHPEGTDLRPNRRDGRGADDIVARAARRRAQLGLSVLLAARRDDDAAGADERRLLRRSGCMARLAPARGGGCAVAGADHVRHRRRATFAGAGAAGAARLRQFATRTRGQCRARPAAARRLRRSHGRVAPGSPRRPATARGRLGISASLLEHLEASGRSRIRACGKRAAGRSTSLTRK